MSISSVFLNNERRAEGMKDLTKQQGFKFVFKIIIIITILTIIILKIFRKQSLLFGQKNG